MHRPAGTAQHHPLNGEDAQPNRFGLLEPDRSAWILFPLVNDWKKTMSRFVKLAPLAVILVGSVGLGGCASKSFVREQIAPVSQRVDALETRLQETDGTAKAALAEAQAASAQSQSNGQRLDQVTTRVDSVEQRQTQLEQRPRKRARN
jgi:murein lipoprotein